MLNNLSIHFHNENKLLYVEIPKAGCTSIKYELFWKPLVGYSFPLNPVNLNTMHNMLGYRFTKTLQPFKDFFKFAVVRNPYTRFMSAYYTRIKCRDLDVCMSMNIMHYPDEILGDPNKFLHIINKEMLNRNRHTALQTYLLPNNIKDLDFLGQLENMEEVENKLSQVLTKEIKFDRHNKGKAIDYYSANIDIERFNHLFKEDYETLHAFYQPLDSSLFSNS